MSEPSLIFMISSLIAVFSVLVAEQVRRGSFISAGAMLICIILMLNRLRELIL